MISPAKKSTTPSDLAQQAAGTFISDSVSTLSGLCRWLTECCRQGELREAIEKFASDQPEPLQVNLVLVEAYDEKGLICILPCRLSDHESTATFPVEVRFHLNPETKELMRRD